MDSVKFKDLEFLKTKGRPFTTSKEVDILMNRKEIDTKEKKTMSVVEVRYAKNTSSRLKHSAPVFRLHKKLLPILTN